MEYKSTDFPQYRKLINGLRFYKINSAVEFEELQIIGENVYHFTFIAEQYPEKLRIMDMLDKDSEHYDLGKKSEWEQQFIRI